MEVPPAALPPRPQERLRWLDLIPVLALTIAGIILVILLAVTLARLNRSFYQANLGTIPQLWGGNRGRASEAAGAVGLSGPALADAS